MRLSVLDLLGQRVDTLVDGVEPGAAASGTDLYRLKTAGQVSC